MSKENDSPEDDDFRDPLACFNAEYALEQSAHLHWVLLHIGIDPETAAILHALTVDEIVAI